MVIEIKVMPGARKNEIRQDGSGLKVYLTAPAIEGRANDALIDFLAEHYGVRRSQIGIIKGLKSRNKVININGV